MKLVWNRTRCGLRPASAGGGSIRLRRRSWGCEGEACRPGPGQVVLPSPESLAWVALARVCWWTGIGIAAAALGRIDVHAVALAGLDEFDLPVGELLSHIYRRWRRRWRTAPCRRRRGRPGIPSLCLPLGTPPFHSGMEPSLLPAFRPTGSVPYPARRPPGRRPRPMQHRNRRSGTAPWLRPAPT